MFNECESLETLNVSGWNVSKVNDMPYVFISCESLHTVTTMWKINTKNIRNIFNAAQYTIHNTQYIKHD